MIVSIQVFKYYRLYTCLYKMPYRILSQTQTPEERGQGGIREKSVWGLYSPRSFYNLSLGNWEADLDMLIKVVCQSIEFSGCWR